MADGAARDGAARDGAAQDGSARSGSARDGAATPEGLTEQQRRWLASVRAGLERGTGRTLAAWVEIARACPETKPRAQARWLKETHGLGQNHAMLVLEARAAADGVAPADPRAGAAALWSGPGDAALLAALHEATAALPGIVTGQRKGFTSWSRRHAFAAARPVRKGGARLGLAVPPDPAAGLEPPRNEGWSERLTATIALASPEAIDECVRGLLRAAWERS